MTDTRPEPSGGLPLRREDRGEAVIDLRRRLSDLAYPCDDQDDGFGSETEAAVRRFQTDRGLQADGECGPQTWTALVEAGYALGDRLLYQRHPMLRGEDVLALQDQLSALGFDAGRVDGVFGPDTAQALEEFQQNSGLATDGIAGPDTVAALGRLEARRAGPTSVAGVREAEALRTSRGTLEGRCVAVGDVGGLSALATAVARALETAGAQVTLLHHPDPSAQARAANEAGSEVYLGVTSTEVPECSLAYYAAGGFESFGGRHLAWGVVSTLGTTLTLRDDAVAGMRLPILRETKMPAVLCRLGPTEDVVRKNAQVGRALADAISTWYSDPVD